MKQCHRCLIPTGIHHNRISPRRQSRAYIGGAVIPTRGMISAAATPVVLSANLIHSHYFKTLSLPRDATRKRGTSRRPVSVRPSVSLVYCIQPAEGSALPGSPVILVSWGHLLPIIKGNPFSGGGWEKFATFARNNRLSRKPFEVDPRTLWNVNRKSWVADQSVLVPMILSDIEIEKQDAIGQCFSGESSSLT